MTARLSLTRAARKCKPKFRVGQVVALIGYSDPSELCKIKKIFWCEEFPYLMDNGSTYAEADLRPLTKRERGQ